MNKPLYFVLGLIAGAAGGTAVTYYVVNAKRDEELEEYSEHCEERIEKFRRKYSGEEEEKEVKDDTTERHCQDPEEEKIENNEGVKKYHVRPSVESKYGENHIFASEQPKKEKKEIIDQINKSEKESKLIEDIEEEEYLNDNETYDHHVIDILLGDDADIVGFWGYQTDNEMFIEDKYGKDLKKLIGISGSDYDYLLGQVDEDDEVGHIYIRNNEIMVDFEVVIHDMREEDKKS